MASIYTMVENHFAELDKAYDEIQSLRETIEEKIADNGGEFTPEIELLQNDLEDKESFFDDMQKAAAEEAIDMVDDYGKWLKNLDSDIAGLKAEEARMAKRRRSKERKRDWVKGNIICGMNAADKSKISGQLFTASIRNTSSVEVDEKAALAPYKNLIDVFAKKFPVWLSWVPKFNKTLAKSAENLPEGFSIVSNQSLSFK